MRSLPHDMLPWSQALKVVERLNPEIERRIHSSIYSPNTPCEIAKNGSLSEAHGEGFYPRVTDGKLPFVLFRPPFVVLLSCSIPLFLLFVEEASISSHFLFL